MIFSPKRKKCPRPMENLSGWQTPVRFPSHQYPAADAQPYPPALPIHTPQTTLWRLETEKPSRRKFLRRQRTFKYK